MAAALQDAEARAGNQSRALRVCGERRQRVLTPAPDERWASVPREFRAAVYA